MWADEVLPRLAARGVGVDSEVRTLRLTGIGESQVAERLGEPLLRATNPIVATYARHEAVDVRISARARDGRSAHELADEAEAAVLAALGDHVWARGETSWSAAIAAALAAHGWTLATVERGTGGALVALLRGTGGLRHAEVVEADGDGGRVVTAEADLAEAGRMRHEAGADVGLAVRARRRRRGHGRGHRGRDPGRHAHGPPRRVPAREPRGGPGGHRGRLGAADRASGVRRGLSHRSRAGASRARRRAR